MLASVSAFLVAAAIAVATASLAIDALVIGLASSLVSLAQ